MVKLLLKNLNEKSELFEESTVHVIFMIISSVPHE